MIFIIFLIVLITIITIIIVISKYEIKSGFMVLDTSDDKEDEECGKLLSRMNINVMKFIKYLKINYPCNETDKLVKEYDDDDFIENKNETYVIKKGKKIHLCLRTEDGLIDDNTLMYVIIHELSHIVTPEYGHTTNFWNNMDWLINKAIECNIYNYHDYKKNPIKYCGTLIDNY